MLHSGATLMRDFDSRLRKTVIMAVLWNSHMGERQCSSAAMNYAANVKVGEFFLAISLSGFFKRKTGHVYPEMQKY